MKRYFVFFQIKKEHAEHWFYLTVMANDKKSIYPVLDHFCRVKFNRCALHKTVYMSREKFLEATASIPFMTDVTKALSIYSKFFPICKEHNVLCVPEIE